MSVILVTSDGYASFRKTMEHLRAQTVQNRLEVVVLAPSAAQPDLDPSSVEGFHNVQVVPFGTLNSLGAGRAAAVRAARAPIVAFAENHCFPAPDWAQTLIEAHRGPWVAVGPSLGNANPRTLRSWTLLLTCFGPCVERTTAEETAYLAWHNTSYKRTAFLETTQELGDLLAVEGFLQARLRSQGLRLWMQPAARTMHTNSTRWRSWFGVLFLGGRSYGANRAKSWSVGRRLLYAGGFFLIPLVRFPRVLRDLREANLAGRLLPQILPCLGLALLVHSVGEVAGYLAPEQRGYLREIEEGFNEAGLAGAAAVLGGLAVWAAHADEMASAKVVATATIARSPNGITAYYCSTYYRVQRVH
jgi:hypothetical protein